ncbi:MAG: oxaloacetate decarboxylase [Candidatus Epulonipiscium fishelsonii]|nr:MAG: oxaloacetate decarboxylase [Epulopiscium sp. AS2M-Bin002]
MAKSEKKPAPAQTLKPVPKPVKIMDTTLRDSHQSLIATRMTTDEMLPILSKMDNAGFYAMEVWGGATFDACLRFLKEDPWERLRKIRQGAPKTKLQMLFRGQNILGYRHYADDVVDYFVQKSIANGIDVIRIFDALNDIRNLERAVKASNKEKGHAQIAISYTISEVHTLEYYMKLAKNIEALGASSICVKDMAGLLVPYEAEKLIGALKKAVKIPIQLHNHYTSGIAAMTYLKAVEAGCDIIDTAMSPFSMGTSQPATEVLVKTFQGTEYDTGINLDVLSEIAEYFRPMREKAIESGLMSTKMLGVDINTLRYQVPGGMLSNLVSQLKQQGAEDKFYDVLQEIPRVRADFGFIPLVTPTSQIVGNQAVMNVLAGERYKMVSKEAKGIVKGEYGKTMLPISEEIVQKVIGNDSRISCRPADLIEPELEKLKKEVSRYSQQEEDVLSYALFPQVATDFFEYREAQQTKVDPASADKQNKAYPV